MVWLVMCLFLEVSYFPFQNVAIYENESWVDYSNSYGGEFGIKAELFDGLVFVEASTYSLFHSTARESFDFSPNSQDYRIGVGVAISEFLFIGYEHSCFHPVMAYYPLSKESAVPHFEGSYDRLYVRFESKFTIGGRKRDG